MYIAERPNEHPQVIEARSSVGALELDAYINKNFGGSYADAYVKALSETRAFSMVLHTATPQAGDVAILCAEVVYGPPHKHWSWKHCDVASICGPSGALLLYTAHGFWPVVSYGAIHSVWQCTLGHVNPGTLAKQLTPYYSQPYTWGKSDCFSLMNTICDSAE